MRFTRLQIPHLLLFLISHFWLGNIEISMYFTLVKVWFNNISCLPYLPELGQSGPDEQFKSNSDPIFRMELWLVSLEIFVDIWNLQLIFNNNEEILKSIEPNFIPAVEHFSLEENSSDSLPSCFKALAESEILHYEQVSMLKLPFSSISNLSSNFPKWESESSHFLLQIPLIVQSSLALRTMETSILT